MINIKFLIKDPTGCLLSGFTQSQKDVIKNYILMDLLIFQLGGPIFTL